MVIRSLHQLADAVRRFRLERGESSHLPEFLREATAQLAASDGIRAVSRDLGISRNTIKLWMQRYPVVVGARAGKPTRSRAALPPPGPGTPLSAAVPAPIAFFEIKTIAAAVPDCRLEASTSSLELTRPDGWVLRASGELAKELASTTFQRFFTSIPGEMT